MGIIDPFGAQEFLVSGVGNRELIGTDIIRAVYYVTEGREQIARVRLLWPIASLLTEQAATAEFLRGGRRSRLLA